jgi:hypothetical protein
MSSSKTAGESSMRKRKQGKDLEKGELRNNKEVITYGR